MNQKLILHVPHSSDTIPEKTGYLVSETKLKSEILLLTDWYTGDLFTFDEGISITADFSRVFCDVERFADDSIEIMSQTGMGAIYTKTDDGSELRKVSTSLKTKILDNYYYPHHERLTAAVDEQLNLYGSALIIDCHSFSSKPFKRDISQDVPRPDFCIGTDDYHTPRGLSVLASVGLKMLGYSVSINTPYSGSIVPLPYFQKDKRVRSVMIEANRDLYMIPGSNKKSENYNKTKSDIHKLLNLLSKNTVVPTGA